MKRLLSKRVPALALALLMVLSLVPAALADDWSAWIPLDSNQHQRTSINDPSRSEVANHRWTKYETTETTHTEVCADCGYKRSTVSHTLGSWQSDASNHWKVCSVCGERVSLGGHVDADSDGRCDTCNYAIPTNTVRVTFITSGSTFATQNVTRNSSPTNPGTPTKSSSSKKYVFKGWSTENPGTAALYTGQSYLTASQLVRVSVSRDTTYYALFTESSKSDITYDVDPGKTVQFNRADFEDFFENQRSRTDTLRYVRFETDNSLKDTVGSIYYDYKGDDERLFDRTRLENYDFYYRSASYGNYPLSGLSFVAASRSDGKTVSINFTAFGDEDAYSGTLLIRIGEVSSGASGDITYKVDAGKAVKFNRNDFEDFFDDEADRNDVRDTFRYVRFQTDSSLRTSNGTVYYDYDGREEESFDRDALEDYKYYFSSSSYGDYPISGMSFVASTRGDGNVVTLGFTAYGASERYSGTLVIRIGNVDDKETSGDINYKVDPGKSVIFNRSDFNSFYREKYSGTLSYVTFSATAISGGELYCDDRSFTRNTLSNYSFYYSASRDGDYPLNNLTFEAESGFDGEVTLKFTAYGEDPRDYVTGTVVIRSTISSSKSNLITYNVKIGDEVAIRRSDFKNIADKKLDGTFRYVTFSTTSTLNSGDGTIFYAYGTNDEREFTRNTLSNYKFYYSSSAYGDYALDDLTFVAPRGTSSRTISFSYVIYDSDNESVKGTMEINVGDTASSTTKANITYKVAASREVKFTARDFNDFYQKQSDTTNTIRYVTFTTSDVLSKTLTGSVYYNYGQPGERVFSNTDLQNMMFYYDSASDGDYPLSALSFVASSRFTTAITLEFTAWYSSSRRERGTLSIQPESSGSSQPVVTITYGGDIRYLSTYDDPVRISSDEISRFFRRQFPSGQLMSVRLDGVPATGSLFYNYYGTSPYGSTVRKQITSSNYSSQDFYFSPTNQTQYSLAELTYIPVSGVNACAVVPFTATGAISTQTAKGTILISATKTAVQEVYGVTPKGTAVTFPATALASAVSAAVGIEPASFQLLALPAGNVGTVYAGTDNSTPATTTQLYAYPSGTTPVSSLRFVPVANYTGSVEIPYLAMDSAGKPIAAGNFCLGLVTAVKRFSDVTSSTWCYKYVTELADSNVIGGYSDGSFRPASTVTYGAALKLIMLAAGYPEQAPTDPQSVFSGYLARARAEGIITRSNVNLATPITRLQVAQIAAGALKLDTVNLSSVQPFTDTNDPSVQALNAAGIVGGYFENGVSTFQPQNNLSRGAVSAIVWRMQNYRK